MIGRNDTIQTEYKSVSWGNGLVKAKTATSGGDYVDFSGFFAEAGDSSEFDAAMKLAGFETMETEHPNDGGVPTYKSHWNLGRELAVLPITMGVPGATSRICLNERNRPRLGDSGIGLAWVTRQTRSGVKPQTVFSVIAYIPKLISVGYTTPIRLSAKGMMTEYLIQALADHTRLAKFADNIVDRQKHPETIGLWEIEWRVGRGEKKVPFTGRNGASSLVFPVVSLHPRELTKDYVMKHYIKGDVRAAIVERLEDDWSAVQDWARGFNAASGTTNTDPSPSNSSSEEYEGIVIDLSTSDNGVPSKFDLGVENDVLKCIVWDHSILDDIDDGDVVHVTGKMRSHEKYGDQFVVSSVVKNTEAPF